MNNKSETTRKLRVFGWLEIFWQDVRHAVRMLSKRPGFTFPSLLSLALGIGATTAIFSIFDAVWLRPLPYKNADRLVVVSEVPLADATDTMGVALGNFVVWREQCTSFESLAAMHWGFSIYLTGGEQGELVMGRRASKGFYEMVGFKPLLGRLFLPEEYEGGPPVAVILSYDAWQRIYGADPDILGKHIGGRQRWVIGVMPPDFHPLGDSQVDQWETMGEPFAGVDNRRAHYALVLGLLKQGVSVSVAQSEMDIIAARLAEQYPDQKGMGARVEPLQEYLYGGWKPRLAILFGAVGFLLLIACSNVASLLLVRAASRDKEIAVRSSLGASRPRLVRQLLLEGGLLSSVGAAFGVLLAFLGVKLLVGISPGMIPRADEIGVSLNVLIFALLVAILCTLLFGLGPALGASKPNLNESLKETGRPTPARFGGRRTHSILVVTEIALSLVLLIGVALMAHSIWSVLHIDTGIDEQGLATLTISLPAGAFQPYERSTIDEGLSLDERVERRLSSVFTPAQLAALTPAELQRQKSKLKLQMSSQINQRGNTPPLPRSSLVREQIQEGLESLPGVESVSMAAVAPVLGCLSRSISVGDQPLPSGQGEAQTVCMNGVSPDYFRTLRIPVLKGRAFDNRDEADSSAVAVISEGLAARYFPDQDPIGKVLNIGRPSAPNLREPPVQIVGVVPDVRQSLLHAAFPALYIPYSQMPQVNLAGPFGGEGLNNSFVIRAAVDPESLQPAIRRLISEVNRNIVIGRNDTVSGTRVLYLRSRRFYAWLLGVFAGIAVVLAAVGLHGVMSYAVARRTHEIGIRVALGARPRDVLLLILKQGLLITVLGLGIGIAGAWGLTRFLASQLYQVEPTDIATFAVTAAVLFIVALTACFLPAWRAVRLNPNEALRYE